MTVAGWGKISDQEQYASSKIYFATGRRVMSNEECRRVFGIIDSNICIDTSDNEGGICQGDSGGPLNLPVGGGQYMTIGVTSFTASAGCELGYPNGYARVTSFLDWISQNTGLEIP